MPWQKTQADRRQDAQRYGAKWRRARLACLEAAHWRCQIQLPGCAGAASQVDHVDGAGSDPHHQHLRATCRPCHEKVTAQQGGGYRSQAHGAPDPSPRPRTSW